MKKSLDNIVIKFGDGSQIYLEDFFYAHYSAFAAFATKYVSDRSIGEDIVQDVFISFLEKRNKFLNINSLKIFFYVSIRNSCLDNLKHLKVQKRYVDFVNNVCEETEFFLDEIIRNEAYDIVYNEINKLPEMGRKVLLLSMEENSNEEIAEQLNIGINTVRTHKARSYKVLRKRLSRILVPPQIARHW
ncbi:MAG: sigma-70 family RNA polymerase sigma factor [Draconibacterium sp.]